MNYPIKLYSDKSNPNTSLIPIQSFKTGKSEPFFEYKLNKYFKGWLFTNISIDNPTKRFPYQPDYVIKVNDELIIDIEIDEPCTYDVYGKFLAIHTCEKDNKRNEFFLEHGWDIIRFTEEQVALYPNACCKLISEHMFERTLNSIYIQNFATITDLPEKECWSEQEARTLWEFNFRDSYETFLKPLRADDKQIEILADGIYFNKIIRDGRYFYTELYPNKNIPSVASLKFFLEELSKYFGQLDISGNDRTVVSVQIFISTWHSFESIDISNDQITIGKFLFDITFIRTDKIVCFEINDYVIDKSIDNVIILADDPTYPLLLEEWKRMQKNIIICGKNEQMPNLDFRRIDPDIAVAKSLGLKNYEA